MRRRLTALIMAVLMLLQLLPVLAVAETVGEIISDVLTAPEMHTVSFLVDGEKIHTVFVQNGGALGILPDAPEYDSRQFEGWYADGELLTVDYIVSADVAAEAVYTDILPQVVEKTFDFDSLVLSGVISDEVDVQAEEVTKQFTDAIGNAHTVYAWNISMQQEDVEYIADKENPMTAAVQLPERTDKVNWQVWQLIQDQDWSEITDCAIKDGVAFFDVLESGVYLIAENIQARTLRATDPTYDVSVTYGADANLPMDGLELIVSEITAKDADYENYVAAVADKVGAKVENISLARAFDIRIVSEKDHDMVYEPMSDVNVMIRLPGEALGEYEHVDVLHFIQTRGTKLRSTMPAVDDMKETVDGETITFTTSNFSIYVVAGYTLEKIIQAGDGNTYKISVTFGKDALLPDDAELEVQELQGELLDDYIGRTAVALNAAGFEYARVFDISIVGKDGTVLQPGAEVQVSIELLDAKDTSKDFNVVHFGEETADPVTSVTEGNTVKFGATGFSAYAIVLGPEPVPMGFEKVDGMTDLAVRGPQGLYIGHVDGYFFTDGITTITTNPLRTGITKTKPASINPPDDAVLYYFEAQSGTNRYKVYCMEGGTKKYVVQNTNSLNFTYDADQANIFTLEQGTDSEIFRVRGNESYYWNMQGSASGKSFAAYKGAGDANAQLHFWYASTINPDPYGLDGKTYGLMNWTGGVAGRALMDTSSASGSLDAKALTVMTHKQDHEDKLFVPSDSDITMWTFEYVDADRYYLKATVDGATKYLKISSTGLSLLDQPDSECKLTVVPGVGTHAGQICLMVGGIPLAYSGNIDTGFENHGSAGNEWLYLVDLDTLTTDYYRIYSATAVGVSDSRVTNGSPVIVYSRVWNDTTKEYEYYAIDHDGSLVRCYESGGEIQWVSGQLNTMLWNLVEYYNEDNTTPNYYYELYNQYSEKFIAPQVTGDQIFSSDPIGINLPGRRNGEYYSSIIAWDSTNFTYAYLKADGENGEIVTIPQAESLLTPDAVQFCFAIVKDLPVDDNLQTVATVDHEQSGITMRIIDIGTKDEMDNLLGNNEGGIGTTLHQGLLSNSLGGNNYPTTTLTNRSLSEMYSGARQVNHLFLEGTYHSTGYFEFDSTQNFASLPEEDNEFVVYKEIASYDGGSRPTLKHGQFFPFNDIQAGVYASVNGKNLYDVHGVALNENDPRKYEPLYLIKNVNTQFAVELEASFVQTPDGKDDWGHDIIYQFTGDDDFWLYVDGELVIDLGGIHSAVPGSVNYRTGEVNVNGTHTTLREIFKKNYMSRGNSEADAEAYVNGIFELSSDGNHYVFKDNTTHTMRIFYMERGGGASNLQMRFNLSSVKKGTVMLNKQLAGVDASETILAEYPYQIWYKLDGETEYQLTPQTENAKIVYKDTTKDVKFVENLTIGGVNYPNVFMLKPGETAEIDFGLGTDVYYQIIECGTNTSIYNPVKINGAAAAGTVAGEGRRDFATGYASSKARANVNYVNTVLPEARRTLTITKRVYKEDGLTLLEPGQDNGFFNIRLYLGTEFESMDSLSGADMYIYHIRDLNGNYCKWDVDLQKFVPIRDGANDYSLLTESEKNSASFATSMNGAISNVPSNFSVEVRQLLAGTQFKVEERKNEIPDGYSLQDYSQNGTLLGPTNLPQGTMTTNRDEDVIIFNHRGFGLRANKIWSDKDYMAERDATYFAVFVPGENGPELVEDSVRQMPYGTNTLYWYYLKLPVTAFTSIYDYSIYEVTLTGTPVVDNEGVVTEYTSIAPIGDEGTVTLEGRQKGETESSDFNYTVRYRVGTVPKNSTVRVDTVTNSRPGIIFYKQDMAGSALANVAFTLKDNSGNEIGTFISDSEGKITDAFLRENVDYTLTETSVPQGYQGIETPITVRMVNGVVTVTGVDQDLYNLTPGTDTTKPVVTIKNRPYTLEVVKKNSNGDSLAGVHFELHKQKTVGSETTIDLTPEPGYEDLVSGTDGIVPKINNTLPAGTYELWEKPSPSGGYMELGGHIRFTISPMHVITGNILPGGVTLENTLNDDGSSSYVMTVLNDLPRLTLTKYVTGDFADYNQEFTFTLTVAGAQSGATYSYTKGTTTGSVENGGTFVLKDSETITFILPAKVNVTISENDNANGIYEKTWTMISGSAATVSGNQMTVVLNNNSVYTIENHLDAISPTGYYSAITPYLWMMGAGVLLLLLKCFRKKRSTEEGGWSS